MNKSVSKSFLVFIENKNGKALTMIPEDVYTLELRLLRFLLLAEVLRKSYALYIYFTLMCNL